MKKVVLNYLVIAALAIAAALTSCGKIGTDEKEDLAPTGTLAPPEWSIGEWENLTGESLEGIINLFKITSGDIEVGISLGEVSESSSLIAIYEMANENIGDRGTIKVKEVAKNSAAYEIGVEYTVNNNSKVEGAYTFKKGDGAFLEIAAFDTDAKKYGAFVKFTKKGNGDETPSTGLSLNKNILTLESGKTETLTANLSPADANSDITWSSSNENVATVVNGVVTAKATGISFITATAKDGKLSSTCTVGVNAITITLDNSSYEEILMAGSGNITIFWDDVLTVETHTLLPSDNWNLDARYVFSHFYSDYISRTIIITGENITHFSFFNSNVTSLDISKNDKLTTLAFYSTKIENLDVSKNTSLTSLVCFYNKLSSLDLSNNTLLTVLSCGWNQLTSLDVSNNTLLISISFQCNLLSDTALNEFFETLHDNPGTKYLYPIDNPGAGTCNRIIATTKGWTFVD